MDFEIVKKMITEQIKDAQVDIHDLTGTRDHLAITIISDEFKDKMLIEQHRMIMDILKEKLGTEEIHAVQLKTLTTDKAREKGLL